LRTVNNFEESASATVDVARHSIACDLIQLFKNPCRHGFTIWHQKPDVAHQSDAMHHAVRAINPSYLSPSNEFHMKQHNVQRIVLDMTMAMDISKARRFCGAVFFQD
jgi:hypothetical protein